MESAPRYGVLGRYTACSTKRIEVLSNKIERSPKAIVMKSAEIIYHKVYASPRPPPTISYKDNWTCNLDPDVARSSEDIQRIELEPIPNSQVQGDLLQNGVKKPWKVPSWIATLLIKRNMIMSQIQRVRGDPYVDTTHQNVVCWHLNMLKMIKQVRWDPYWWRSTKLISEYQDCHTQL